MMNGMSPVSNLALSGVPNVAYTGPIGLVGGERQPLAGLLKVKIGSPHLFGGVSLTARELRAHRTAKGLACICLTCGLRIEVGKSYRQGERGLDEYKHDGKGAVPDDVIAIGSHEDAENALIDHHESRSDKGIAGMIKRGERHVYGFHSSDVFDLKAKERFEKAKETVAKAREARGCQFEGDALWMREQAALNDMAPAAGIIGLLSDES